MASEGIVIDLVASVDQGTQSTRVFLFDNNFQHVASHQTTFTQIRPQPGYATARARPPGQHVSKGRRACIPHSFRACCRCRWCEHDPLEVWLTVQECLIKAYEVSSQGRHSVKFTALPQRARSCQGPLSTHLPLPRLQEAESKLGHNIRVAALGITNQRCVLYA